MSKNIIDKIWDAHIVKSTPNFPDVFYIDRMLMHEVTSAQAFDKLRELDIPVNRPDSVLATVDHSISTCRGFGGKSCRNFTGPSRR